MTHDQDKPYRHSVRLPRYDYRQAGAYFVTMCAKDGDLVLDDAIITGIILDVWASLPGWFPTMALDEFAVMPNHVHLIVWLQSTGLATAGAENTSVTATMVASEGLSPGIIVPTACVLTGDEVCWTSWANPAAVQWVLPEPEQTNLTPLLGDVIGAFKSLVFMVYLDWIEQNAPERRAKFWQRNYYEHVIRNDRELNAIRQYIRDNPENWPIDRDNPQNTLDLRSAGQVGDYMTDVAAVAVDQWAGASPAPTRCL